MEKLENKCAKRNGRKYLRRVEGQSREPSLSLETIKSWQNQSMRSCDLSLVAFSISGILKTWQAHLSRWGYPPPYTQEQTHHHHHHHHNPPNLVSVKEYWNRNVHYTNKIDIGIYAQKWMKTDSRALSVVCLQLTSWTCAPRHYSQLCQ